MSGFKQKEGRTEVYPDRRSLLRSIFGWGSVVVVFASVFAFLCYSCYLWRDSLPSGLMLFSSW